MKMIPLSKSNQKGINISPTISDIDFVCVFQWRCCFMFYAFFSSFVSLSVSIDQQDNFEYSTYFYYASTVYAFNYCTVHVNNT